MSELVVVSGLPRSGTSMMMAALAAGGMTLVQDGQRQADEHNQRGYFEHRDVLKMPENSEWLRQHAGSAVKVIYRLLPHLPPSLPARILFMQRDLKEVLASQQAMLGQADSSGLDWVALFTSEVERTRSWLKGQTQLLVMEVEYGRLLDQPARGMAEVAAFLELPLDVAAMAAAVEPGLRRQRA